MTDWKIDMDLLATPQLLPSRERRYKHGKLSGLCLINTGGKDDVRLAHRLKCLRIH
jgi:hypothetical protein